MKKTNFSWKKYFLLKKITFPKKINFPTIYFLVVKYRVFVKKKTLIRQKKPLSGNMTLTKKNKNLENFRATSICAHHSSKTTREVATKKIYSKPFYKCSQLHSLSKGSTDSFEMKTGHTSITKISETLNERYLLLKRFDLWLIIPQVKVNFYAFVLLPKKLLFY